MTDSQSGHEEREVVAEEPIHADHVGAFLCATRMRLGGDLQEIARILRIRYGYLVAIEDGRYEDLPGSAYSIGFVRAYADYLGLDGNEIIRRLREESAGKVKTTRFDFPAPSGDSGLPNGGLLAVAICLGMVVYAAWYTISNGDRDAVDLIQEVPSRLAVLMDEESADPLANSDGINSGPQTDTETAIPAPTASVVEDGTNSTGEEVEIVSAESMTETLDRTAEDMDVLPTEPPSSSSDELESVIPAEDEAVVASVDSQTTEENEPVSTDPSQDVESSISPDTTPTPEPTLIVAETDPETAESTDQESTAAEESVLDSAPSSSQVPQPINATQDTVSADQFEEPVEQVVASLPEDSVSESEPETIATENNEADVETESAETPAPVQSTAESADNVEESDQQAAVQDNESEASADTDDPVIELRAKSDSWIQVRDGDDLLLTRLLRQGEVYRVPDRDGLTLMTGNAGGLEVFVGGELMPALGDEGVVRRGVPLSADRLRSGVAPG